MAERIYTAIDLKSFYASVECADRNLDPLTTNLVVADESRTEKTICLAVSPSLKAHGIPGRARLFEVHEKVDDANRLRLRAARRKEFAGFSSDAGELRQHPEFGISFIAATPRMARYLEVSAGIYKIYLRYFAPEDMHVYSIDEVFIDLTNYLTTYGLSPEALTRRLILEVLAETGITATAGIGTNLYLSKVALDIEAKKIAPDANGVRIASLDEKSYRRQLWTHRPLTDFWRIGRGIASRLDRLGVETMGDLARCSLRAEEQLYRIFGKNAELLIDHAWGYEPCTMGDIKAYRPARRSLSSGQVLTAPYPADKARLVVAEMADALAMDLTEKELLTDQILLTVGYDAENLRDPDRAAAYKGAVRVDFYGRAVPRHAHGSHNLSVLTDARSAIRRAVLEIFDRVVDTDLLIRRLTVGAGSVTSRAERDAAPRQLSFLGEDGLIEAERESAAREQALQQAVASLRERYGKNVLFQAADLQEGATALQRNRQIGGHRA